MECGRYCQYCGESVVSKIQAEELRRLDTEPTRQPKSVRGWGSHRGPQRRRGRGR